MANLVLYQSYTGNTETFLEFLKTHSKNELVISSDFNIDISLYDKIAFGAFTWSNGKIPKKMKQFLIDNHHLLKDKEVFVFGSGNSIYPKFCAAVDGIIKICSDSGAKIIGSFKFEQRFNESNFSKQEINNLIKTIEKWSA